VTDIDNGGTLIENTIVFALNDTSDGHNVPSMGMGTTADGFTLMAKAVFANQESADRMAEFMNKQSGCTDRFAVVMVELWRPTDIELYVRDRLRKAAAEKGPQIILPGA